MKKTKAWKTRKIPPRENFLVYIMLPLLLVSRILNFVLTLQVPHRLLTFELTRNIEVCVICGPSPSLAELEPEVRVSLFSLYPTQMKFGGVYRNHPVCLSVHLPVKSKLNLGYNFWTKGDRAFILHMCIPCEETFLSVPKILTSRPWPWLLTKFRKKLT